MPNYRRDSPCPVESQFVNSCQAFNGTAAGPFARGGRSMVLASALLVLGCRPLTGAPIADWTTSSRLGVLPDVVANVLSAAWGYCLGVGCTFVNENVNTPNGPLQGLGNLGTAGQTIAGATPGFFDEYVSTSVALFPTSATENLVFARQFNLSGSPTGWTATLIGNYGVYGYVNGADYDPQAKTSFNVGVYPGNLTLAQIFSIYFGGGGLNGNLLPNQLGYSGPGAVAGLKTPPDPNVFGPLAGAFTPVSGVLQNGTYWVIGQEFVTGQVENSLTPTFVTGATGASFDATINLGATPAPVALLLQRPFQSLPPCFL